MKRTLAITCTLLVLALMTGTATADPINYYVRNGGTGTGGLSWGDAFGTIQEAWNKFPGGGSSTTQTFNIYIEKSSVANPSYAGATRTGGFILNKYTATVNHYGGYTVIGDVGTKNGGDVSNVLEADTWAFHFQPQYVMYGATFSFDDMNITGKGAVFVTGGDTRNIHLEAERTVFTSTSTDSGVPVVKALASRGIANVTMDRCLVAGGADGGIFSDVGDSDGAGVASGVTLANTAIVDAGLYGIYAEGSSYSSGSSARGRAFVDLNNVTISGVDDVAVWCGEAGLTSFYNQVTIDGTLLNPGDSASTAYMFRNDDNVAMTVAGADDAFYGYSAWDNGTDLIDYTGLSVATGHDQPTGDPLLNVDGFHLTSGSPMIDAATTGLSEDYDGEARPQGSGYDIGADEYVPEPATMGLLGLGFAGMAALRRRRRRA